MFSSPKTAAAAAFVAGLAAIVVGAAHAYADAAPEDCSSTAQGDVVCVRKSDTHVDKDGTHVLKQEQSCETTDRPHVIFRDEAVPAGESAAGDGSVAECSNTARLPEGFKKPHIGV